MSIGHNGRDRRRSRMVLSPCLSSPSIVPLVEVPGAGSPSLLPPVSLNTIREAPVSFPSNVTVESGRSTSKPRREQRCSPLGPASSSVRKPSGPTATLVGMPRDVGRREGLNDFLGFLLKKRSIFVLVAKRRTKWWTHNSKPTGVAWRAYHMCKQGQTKTLRVETGDKM